MTLNRLKCLLENHFTDDEIDKLVMFGFAELNKYFPWFAMEHDGTHVVMEFIRAFLLDSTFDGMGSFNEAVSEIIGRNFDREEYDAIENDMDARWLEEYEV